MSDPGFYLNDDEPAASPQNEFEIGEYIGRLRRRWKLILGVAAVVLIASLVKYQLTPPAYRAETTIQIERRSLTPFTSSSTPWLENWWNMEFYPTQYALLRSRGLAELVVDELDLSNDPQLAATDTQPAAADPADGDGAEEAVTNEEDKEAAGRAADRLRAGLSVSPQRGTQLVVLSYIADDPQRAARVVNTFADEYIKMGNESRTETVNTTSDFLDQQIEELKETIDGKEQEYQDQSANSDLVDSDPESNVTRSRLASLNDDYMRVVRDRIEAQAEYQALISAPRESVADRESSGLVSSLRQEQLRLERDYETQRQNFKPDWPPLVELRGEIEQGRKHLDDVIEREAQKAIRSASASVQTLRRQESTLAGEIETAKDNARTENRASVGVANLRVEIDSHKDLLDELLKRRSETAVAASLSSDQTQSSNVRVIESALVPRSKFRPDLGRSLTIGLLGGLLLGLGLAALLEFLDRTVKNETELERLLGLPVLTVIPDVSAGGGYGYGYGEAYGSSKSGSRSRKRWAERRKTPPVQVELAPHRHPKQRISEAYRALRTALLLSSAEELRVVGITSAAAGEGKTVTTMNLAIVLAQLGRRVLVIDADLRKPRQHTVFGLSNRQGVVNFLAQQAAVDGVVLRTEVPNLWIMTAGTNPPNPSELLASDRMRSLVAEASKQYDMVLIDTPPTLAVTDSTIIGSMCDGMVLCFRAGKVLREEVRACRDRLQRADVRLLGAVLNRRQASAGGLYKRYEAYGEAYGESPESAKHSAA